MSTIYGVARISTGRQNIERQIRNILEQYPTAKIIKETYTGTKLEGRKDFENLLKRLQDGDTWVFDSVSRMSRNADEGCKLYEDLYNKNINLIFLKEPLVNTDIFKQELQKQMQFDVELEDKEMEELMNTVITALNKYAVAVAKKQIRKAFEQSEKEVKDLHQRTSEGIETARLAGKQIGQRKGAKLITKKSQQAKAVILKHSKDFDGNLSDDECIKLAGVSRNSYYKYKCEIKTELSK